MKKLISCLAMCLLVCACAHQVRLSPVAGTQPADFSWHCEQNFPQGQPSEKTVVPQGLDVRSCDVSAWDFSNYSADELADVLMFDSKTKFPPNNKMPKGFHPKQVLENGKNPGLSVRALHKKGITGKGVNVAIIDQNLLLDHEQYADRIRYYWQDPIYQYADSAASMHGAAVTSILAGKTVGVAPQANIYYWANNLKIDENDVLDAGAVAEDLIRVLTYNSILPPEERIRAVSISRGFGEWDKNADQFNQAVKELEAHGIAVFTTNNVATLSRTHSLSSPDTTPYCRPAYWFAKDEFAETMNWTAARKIPLIPTDFRVTAAPNGVTDYVHYAQGGLSWAVPYLSGLYALGVQVYPDLTKEVFLQAVRDTADTKECHYQGTPFTAHYFVNPTALIAHLHKLAQSR